MLTLEGMMGIIKHETVIVTMSRFDIEPILEFRDTMPEGYRSLLVGPINAINATATFILAPDGSKEFWTQSDEMDVIRADFIELLKGIRADWAHIALYDEIYHSGRAEDRPRVIESSRWTFDGEMFRPDNGPSWMSGRHDGAE